MRASFYLLPIFFFVLSVSPNISGDRIGLVLVSVYILLVPPANYFGWRLGKIVSTTGKPSYVMDIMALAVLIGALYIGWGISWQYWLMQMLFVALLAIKGVIKRYRDTGLIWYLVVVIYAFLFYSLIYLGLNQYSFEILFRLNNIIQALLTATVIVTIFHIDQISEAINRAENNINKKLALSLIYLFLQLLTFGIFFQITSEIKYAFYFALVLTTPLVILIKIKNQIKNGTVNNTSRKIIASVWLLASFQTLFFLYYFLDTSQVLQAIQGGY